MYIAAGTVTVFESTLSGDTAYGGDGGAGGAGGSGPIAAVFGLGSRSGSGTRITTGFGSGSGSNPSSHTGITGVNTGGPGGNGGSGAAGDGGGLFIGAGTISIVDVTFAQNLTRIGKAGAAGPGGPAGTGKLTGGAGVAGTAGNAAGGGIYVSGGTVSLLNATVTANSVATHGITATSSGATKSTTAGGTTAGTAGGRGGGLMISGGSVFLESTIVAQNTSGTKAAPVADDIAGTAVTNSSFNLVGTGGDGGLTTSDHNQLNVANPDLGSLAANGGLTQTIALTKGSPAIGKGANPDNLFADQRGYGVSSSTKWDVGAYQTTATADTTAPTASLQATEVTSANASSLNPYEFTLTFDDNLAVSAVTVSGATVQVVPPGQAAITATLVSAVSDKPVDALDDAAEIVATYEIAPPGGAWTSADNGTYTVTLGGCPVTDLAGNAIGSGQVGTFSVQIVPDKLVVTTQPSNPVTAGSSFTMAVTVENAQGVTQTNFSGSVTIALSTYPPNAVLNGTLTIQVSAGVADFKGLTIDLAGDNYVIQASSSAGVTSATTDPFNVIAAPASQLVVTTQPLNPVTAGVGFSLTVTAEDPYENVATSYTGGIAIALLANPGNDKLLGNLSMNATAGVAEFSGLTLIRAADGYTIQATSTGLTNPTVTTSSFNVVAAPASQLVVTSEPPTSVTAGSAFSVGVTAEDPYNNVATTFTGSITLALDSNPGHDTLKGTLVLTPTNGVASFTGLTLVKADTGYTIQATSTGLTSAVTTPFRVIPAAASQLIVTTQPPANVPVNSPFGLAVAAEDPYGNVVTTASGTVTLSLKKNSGGGRLAGKLSVKLKSGVATFTGLSLNKPGKGYRIQAASARLTAAVTNAFNVTSGAVRHSGRGACLSPLRRAPRTALARSLTRAYSIELSAAVFPAVADPVARR